MLGGMPPLGQVMLQYDCWSVFNYVPALYASVLPPIPGEQLIYMDTMYIVVLQVIQGLKFARQACRLPRVVEMFFVCMYIVSRTVNLK